jgi:hypothetical protein
MRGDQLTISILLVLLAGCSPSNQQEGRGCEAASDIRSAVVGGCDGPLRLEHGGGRIDRFGLRYRHHRVQVDCLPAVASDDNNLQGAGCRPVRNAGERSDQLRFHCQRHGCEDRPARAGAVIRAWGCAQRASIGAEFNPVAPALLGRIQGQVGALDHVTSLLSLAVHGNAEAGGEGAVVVHRQGLDRGP